MVDLSSSVSVTIADRSRSGPDTVVVVPGIVMVSSPSTTVSSVGVMVQRPRPARLELAAIGDAGQRSYRVVRVLGRSASQRADGHDSRLDVRVVPPSSVAVTVIDVAESSSPRVLGLALSVMPVGASSSSVIVVVTVVFDWCQDWARGRRRPKGWRSSR